MPLSLINRRVHKKKKNSLDEKKDMHMLPKASDRVPSPSLLDREYDKSSRFGRLVVIAAKHHLDGKRSTLPAFVPFVVSDFGELAPAAIDLQEWMSTSTG